MLNIGTEHGTVKTTALYSRHNKLLHCIRPTFIYTTRLPIQILDVSNKVAATSRFDCLRYSTLRYGRYLRSTTSRT